MNNEDFLQAYLADRQKIVEEALQRYLPDEDNSPQELHTAVHYSEFAGGKRIRPILCLAALEACGGSNLLNNGQTPLCRQPDFFHA